ncbi:MAG TPA: LLM class F420-dependent oxidoreductase [Myxococcales bacterium]|nr:LLM class F420-dependent oxidoreductase [Myxococcales bacterium]
MRVGLFLATINPIATPEYVSSFARAAEERGFDSLWVGEHALLFDDYDSPYPYSEDGKLIGLTSESGMLDPFLALTWAAAATREIKLATGICILPQRNPVYTAKEVATLDWLSGGRTILGLGIGWLEEEFRSLGVPFERRAARCAEYVEVLKRLWCDAVSNHEGEFHRLVNARCYPKPVQDPHPPILFGGESDAALRRAAGLGDGWFGFNHTPQTAAECLVRLTHVLEMEGRRLADLEISVSPYLQPCEGADLARFEDLGVDRCVLLAMAPTVEKIPPTLDAVAREYGLAT